MILKHQELLLLVILILVKRLSNLLLLLTASCGRLKSMATTRRMSSIVLFR